MVVREIRRTFAFLLTVMAWAVVFALVAGCADSFFPPPPPNIRVYTKSGACVPCWHAHIWPTDAVEWKNTEVTCAYRLKDGGFNYMAWPLSQVSSVASDRQAPLTTDCPAHWGPLP